VCFEYALLHVDCSEENDLEFILVKLQGSEIPLIETDYLKEEPS
jgi:hypothetical protein